jgi:2,3-diketo-5-methylthio-1-phosphopentane phosphatase
MALLCDFDGTVTANDVAESILREFAGGDWWAVEERYRAGEIGSMEALRLQFALVTASREELLAFVEDTARVDPAFKDLVAYCGREDVPLMIVSDGLDFYIEAILTREGLDVPFTANACRFGGDGLEIEFPHAPVDCPECGRCANCKLQTVKEWRRRLAWVAFAGEGHSDFWAARGADHVFAKGPLLLMCREERLVHSSYESFADIQRQLEARLRE